VVELAQEGAFHLIVSPFILTELERALRTGAGWRQERLALLRKRLPSLLTIVEPTTHVHTITRLDADNRILECALDAHAEVLVTGNMKDLRPLGSFRGIPILTPREFLETYFPA